MTLNHSPSIVTSNLVFAIDPANKKSYSQNEFQNSTDIFAWSSTGAINATISRDTISSPVGNTPLKMAVTGNDPYLLSYNSAAWNIIPAANGQTWIVSAYVKASVATTGQIFIFNANSSGDAFANNNYSANTFNVTTEWTRVQHVHTMNSANTAFIHLRLDGPDSGGTGQTIWWDGLQVERVPTGVTTATNFTSSYTVGNTIKDITGTQANGALLNYLTYNSSNSGSLVFNGTNNAITLGSFFNYSNFTINLWVYPGSTQAQYADIFDNNHTGTQNFVCQQDNLNTNTYGFGCNSATNSSAVANFTLAANTWHNLTFTWNNSVASHYTNGIFVSSGSAANPINYSSQSLRLGQWGGGGRNWNGRIGVVMIYNRVLTATEIRSNFNALRGRYEI